VRRGRGIGTTLTHEESDSDRAACSVVREMVARWAQTRDRPFPYLEVGDHLTRCPDCLVWSTTIAWEPGGHYLAGLKLELNELLACLGESLLALVSSGHATGIRFEVRPDALPAARAGALGFLKRYRSFSTEAGAEAERIQQVVVRAEPETGPVTLEPYELVRYFFQTALDVAPDSERRLSLLVYLGVTENYRALAAQQRNLSKSAAVHFGLARGYFGRVLAHDPRQYKGTATATAACAKSALVAARVNLAGTEVHESGYSEAALRRSVALLNEARALVAGLALPGSEHTAVYSNLLISLLRLQLDHSQTDAQAEAWRLAEEIGRQPGLAQAFFREWLEENADPELTELLARPEVSDLAGFLRGQAARFLDLPGPGSDRQNV